MSQAHETRVEPRSNKRRPYQAPEVARVKLAPDEVLGVGCKTSSGGAGYSGSCLITLVCSAYGS
jgi:hypothetical protein